MGSQYVYRSLDRGDTWETISPDLTKNQKTGNVPFSTLTVLEESPLEFGTLYSGSDDGNLWITRDHGVSWADISKGLPQNRWISSITPSQYVEGVVYTTLTGYRFDEFNPYVYKSTDYGKTWKSISANLPKEAVNIIKEDPNFENILYLGTDHGLYISLDGGNGYNLFQGNIPNVAIYDMAIQKRENDLVIGTHGRSVYIINLKPIYQILKDPSKEIHALSTSEIRFNPRMAAWTEGLINKPKQYILFYSNTASKTTLSIINEKEEKIQNWEFQSSKGYNQTSWEYGPLGRGKYKVVISSATGADELGFEVK